MSSEVSPMDLFRQFLTQKTWQWSEHDGSTLTGSISGASGRWHWCLRLTVDGDFLVFQSTAPVNVPPPRRRAVMEYLTRANWGMTLATFEMDLIDGEVNCRTSVPAVGVLPSAIEHLVIGNFTVTDRYLPGLMAVIYGKASPRKAVMEAENRVNPADQPAGDAKETESDDTAKPTNGVTRRGRLFTGDN